MERGSIPSHAVRSPTRSAASSSRSDCAATSGIREPTRSVARDRVPASLPGQGARVYSAAAMIPPAVSDPPADARSQPRADEASRPLRPVRVAVVGVGRRGLAHAAVLSMVPDCTLAGLVDPRRPATRSARGQGFKAPAFPSFEKLLEAEKPDAVFVCTPSDRHLPVAKAALEAGAAVFVEKPLAHTLADAEALATLATSTGRPVACGYVLPYL